MAQGTLSPANRLVRSVETIMRGRPDANGFLAFILKGLSSLYGVGVRTRAALFHQRRFESHRLPCQVVSIGNITVGGTGKTPMTLYLAQVIRNAGYRVAVVSRGYKGTAEKKGGVVSDGHALLMPPAIAGDEPYLLAQQLLAYGIPVLVGQNRVQSGWLAVKRFRADVIVLDDGFQHLRLRRDIDIVLLDAAKPFGNGYLLPRGILREPIPALARADGLVLTRCPRSAVDVRDRDRLQALVDRKPPAFRPPVFAAAHIPFITERLPASHRETEGPAGELDDPAGCPIYAFSGIARNEDFYGALDQMGAKLVGTRAFEDHHRYSRAEFENIVGQARSSGARLLITTEKDRVKINDAWIRQLPLLVMGIRMDLGAYAEGFEQFVIGKLQAT
jgi:tetraacyldisaccharide 4'-kinase